MLQLLLSDWIVRFFLLYLFVVGGLALIRRQQQAVSSPSLRLPLADIRDRWADREKWRAISHRPWWSLYNIEDKFSIRIGSDRWGDGQFWQRWDRLGYV